MVINRKSYKLLEFIKTIISIYSCINAAQLFYECTMMKDYKAYTRQIKSLKAAARNIGSDLKNFQIILKLSKVFICT